MISKWIKRIIQIVLDLLFPKVNFAVKTGDLFITKNNKIFNVKEV